MNGFAKALAASVTALALAAAVGIAPAYGASTAAGSKDIVDTAIEAGSFKTLVTAVEAAGLAQTLKSEGPYTVFAPTDQAFAKLPPGTLERLLADKEALAEVLSYHVVPGRVTSGELAANRLTTLRTVQGGSVTVDARISPRVNEAYIVTPDVMATNGVVHAIDSVIMP